MVKTSYIRHEQEKEGDHRLSPVPRRKGEKRLVVGFGKLGLTNKGRERRTTEGQVKRVVFPYSFFKGGDCQRGQILSWGTRVTSFDLDSSRTFVMVPKKDVWGKARLLRGSDERKGSSDVP